MKYLWLKKVIPYKSIYLLLTVHAQVTVDLGEVKTAPTEYKEKCFQMSYLPIFTNNHYSKAPQNMLVLMIHLRKRSGR